MGDITKLGLAPLGLLSPASVAVVGLGLLWLLRDDKDEEIVMSKRLPPIAPAALRPLPSVEPEHDKGDGAADQTLFTPSSEADQNNMIRHAMSELGKRSAAARAKKKAERQKAE